MASNTDSIMRLKLRVSDTLSFGEEKVGRSTQLTLNVNGEIIFFLGWSKGACGYPYRVVRSVFGTVLKIPSAHPSYYLFEDGRYLHNRRMNE